jgi:hypothetical protein
LLLSEIDSEMSFIWPRLGDDAAIKRWAHELCTLRQTASPADWDHVGHGVIVEIEDIDEVDSLVNAAAATARFDFVGVKARDVMDTLVLRNTSLHIFCARHRYRYCLERHGQENAGIGGVVFLSEAKAKWRTMRPSS